MEGGGIGKESEQGERRGGQARAGLGKGGRRSGTIRAKAPSFSFSPGPCLSGGPLSSHRKGPELCVQRPPGENFTWEGLGWGAWSPRKPGPGPHAGASLPTQATWSGC